MCKFGVDMNSDRVLHLIDCAPELAQRPMNNPFAYEPCALVREAADRVVAYLSKADREVREEIARGKMLGVLVVLGGDGEVGFLAAFSGSLAGRTKIDGFVPPIYDLDCEGGYFRREEQVISELGERIEAMERSDEYREAVAHCQRVHSDSQQRIESARAEYRRDRAARAIARQSATPEERAEIDRQSQHQKGELRRLEAALKSEAAKGEEQLKSLRNDIDMLRERRKELSYELQCRMFDSYRVVNGDGEWSSILSIFERRFNRLPPAGSGECAAPKLLHYALCRGLTPVALGEFWQGESPRGEVRRSGEFYGACRGKCEPILNFVLQGVAVECHIDGAPPVEDQEPEILFEDRDIIVFNKPSGMLSVPGKGAQISLQQIVQRRVPSALVAHRLDQDTSGVLVVAKTLDIYRLLQMQFAQRTLQKRYIALVDRYIDSPEGEISLPLLPDPFDRPRQMVDLERGKEAITRYEVLEHLSDGKTRLALYPHSGRTHQLRVHCAHVDGLNAPILGDRLYGGGSRVVPQCDSADHQRARLHLHSEQITLRHPSSNEEVTYRCAPTF